MQTERTPAGRTQGMAARLDGSERRAHAGTYSSCHKSTLTHPAHLPHLNLTQLPSVLTLEPVAEAPQQAISGLKVMGRNGGWGALGEETF